MKFTATELGASTAGSFEFFFQNQKNTKEEKLKFLLEIPIKAFFPRSSDISRKKKNLNLPPLRKMAASIEKPLVSMVEARGLAF